MEIEADETNLQPCPHCGNRDDLKTVNCTCCFSAMEDQSSGMIQNEELFSRIGNSDCRDIYDDGIEFLTIALTRMEMQGLIRMLSQKNIYEIVRAIYNDCGLYVTKERTDTKKLTVKAEKKICPYCQSTVIGDNNLVYCNKCEVPYHGECWQEISSCVIFGCDSKNADTAAHVINLSNDLIDVTDFFDNEELPNEYPPLSSDENLQPENDHFPILPFCLFVFFVIAFLLYVATYL